jgi:hypothetical protein
MRVQERVPEFNSRRPSGKLTADSDRYFPAGFSQLIPIHEADPVTAVRHDECGAELATGDGIAISDFLPGDRSETDNDH